MKAFDGCVYSVSTVGLFPRRCLTCDLNKAHCTFFSADLSPTQQHVILNCKGTALTSIYCINTLLGKFVKVKALIIYYHDTFEVLPFINGIYASSQFYPLTHLRSSAQSCGSFLCTETLCDSLTEKAAAVFKLRLLNVCE